MSIRRCCPKIRTNRLPLGPCLLLLWLASHGPVCAAIFSVTSNADSGPGTLRQALIEANANSTVDRIEFNIAGGGRASIALLSSLPQINEPVTIDGNTQPGHAGAPLIELNGISSGQSAGLRVAAGQTVIRGLILNRFEGGGIRLLGQGSNVVEGCYIGTGAFGTNVLANGEYGIWISSGSSGNRIGDTNAAHRNVISGNAKAGVYVQSSPSNTVQGNFIGLSAPGAASLPNGNNGVIIDASSGAVVDGNVISGNADVGLYLLNSTGSQVRGNVIGLSSSGIAVLGNSADGIRISGGSGHVLGGEGSGNANVVSGNGSAGVFLLDCNHCVVRGNRMGTDAAGTVALGNQLAGLTLQNAMDNVIGGPGSADGNLIGGNLQDGIYLTNSAANRIEGNWIGLSSSGISRLANGFNGIALDHSSTNTIGGATGDTGNIVSGNNAHGISLLAGSTGNIISGNWIGVNVPGTAALPNTYSGMLLQGAGNVIGGASPGARNVISGNGLNGISVAGAAASGNVIQGNRIGTSPGGTSKLGNGGAGIGISDAPATVIGGRISAEGNLISGNDAQGIYLLGTGTHQTRVEGNFIGTAADGNAAIPNLAEGINLEKSGANTIGGSAVGAGNLISGNRHNGIYLTNNASGNVIQGNRIGTKANGTDPLGNVWHAIELESGATDNLIGGSAPGAGNRIAHSQTVYSGVRVRPGATRNAIRGNAIFGNGGLGIDLGVYQTTPNDDCDPDTGANQLQNFPVLSQATASGSGISISGDLNSITGQSYALDFFASPASDPSGYGEGESYLGSITSLIPSGQNCTVPFEATFEESVPAGWKISATATDPAGNTSEFCLGIHVEAIPTLHIALTPPPSNIVLSWTNTASGTVLLRTGSLTPPIQWLPVTNAPTSVNGQWVVTLPLQSAATQFYRLGLQ